ncbi:MAG: helicase-exonuclease AddAB subunit AddA [Clostridia bacterium]|nr:helicase-exonuclease AddAB subunit AddA [Clostridia bacterium]
MAFDFTPMQESAINTEGTVLVSAAAGSGKTAVLVERVIRKITRKENPISLDKMLIVTFTNAAAAEMKRKIEKRLYEVCRENPDDEGLLRQKHLIASADICTIDSFCINLVRSNFDKCGVEPDFTVQDGSGLAAVNNRVMSEVIGRRIRENTPEFTKLLELTGCEYDEKPLAEEIEKIHLYSEQLPFPEKFLRSLINPYVTDFDKEHIWYKTAFEFSENILNGARKTIEKMADAAELLGSKHKAYAETLSLLIDTLIKELSKGEWDGFYKAVGEANIPRQPSVPSDSDDGAVFKICKEKIAKAIEKLRKIFYADTEFVKRDIWEKRPAVELFAAMIGDYSKELFEAYKKENTLTFYNTEQLALSFLCTPTPHGYEVNSAAQEYLSRYDEVLVDEFQDVNDLQDTLFHILSGNAKKLFTVGDVKQSIYGFRGSNPENFMKKKRAYTSIENAKDEDAKKIILSDNFRSRKGICDYVNFVFSRLLDGHIGSIVYNEEEELHASGEFPESSRNCVEFILADKTGDEDELKRLEFEGRCIAHRINEIMNEGQVITDGKALRNAKFSDFVILLDSVKNKASVIAEMLKEAGIPVNYGAEIFFETEEVITVLSLLKIIDNPRNDIELLTVMMSPIFNFSAEEMAKIRADFKKGELYAAVNNSASLGNKKVLDFLETLSLMRREAAVLSVDKLISKLYAVTDYLNFVSAMSGGEARRANLITLRNVAACYCEGSGGGIGGFLTHIRTLPEKAVKSAAKEGSDCVRIMTMHASKGLQFPVCIISNVASDINRVDSSSKILYGSKLGLGFKFYNYISDCDEENLGHILSALGETEKTSEEKMRLLYVAMTRAVDRLIIVSSPKNPVSALNNAASNISRVGLELDAEWLKSSRKMNDWLLATALIHPDAQILRNLCELPTRSAKQGGEAAFRVMNSYNTAFAKAEVKEFTPIANDDITQRIKKNLSYKYPLEALGSVRSKISVSDLANKAESDRFAFTHKPSFMLENGLSAAGKGTATHSVMQFIDMSKKPDVDAEIDRLAEWQYITEEQAGAVDRKAISEFFDSPLYERISKSLDIRREMRFLSEIPASRIDDALPEKIKDTPVIIQGAVDLCFAEEDGIVVLDFKTDRVDNIDKLRETYSEQLNIYAAACEKIMGKPIKEKIIYSFNLSDYISF